MAAENKGLVCVTGGTGFIASWLIMRLLREGYTVRTTLRSHPEGKRDISFLTNLPGASERLQIFHADLNEPESFCVAIEGCSGVLVVAHQMDITDEEGEEIVTRRAINGTLGILKACLKSKTTVKRVVYTSSIAAVMASGNGQDVADESSWSDVEFIKSLKIPGVSYVASKTKTEKAALEFAEEFGINLVTLLPSLVVGPFLCHKIPSSVTVGLTMILGNYARYGYLRKTSFVHIDDVASAHIFLLENPSVNGRYICLSDEISGAQMYQFISAKYPNLQIPKIETLEDDKEHKFPSFSSKKLLNAGFKYKHGLDDIFDGAIQSCQEKGISLNFQGHDFSFSPQKHD